MPQAQILPPRQGIDYGQLGGLVAQAVNPMAGIQKQLLPLLITEEFKSKLAQKRSDAFLDRLQSGAGGLDKYKLSFDKDGLKGAVPLSPKEIKENLIAKGDIPALESRLGGGIDKQPPQPQIPPQVQNILTATQGSGQPGIQSGGVVPTGAPTGPSGFPPDLLPSERRELQVDIAKKQAGARIKRQAGVNQARTSTKIIAGALKGLAQTFADASREGATGNIYRELTTKGILKGLVPGEQGRKLQKSRKKAAAYPGRKAEVVIKMMPILTQQNDKPGSVRLVQTALKLLMNSLPELRHDDEVAIEMMDTTMRNIYGFASAVQNAGSADNFAKQLGLRPEILSALSDKELEAYLGASPNELLNISASLTPAQNAEIELLVADTTSPLKQRISVDRGEQSFNAKTHKKQINTRTGEVRIVPR
jgi:hypothetical protein